MSAALMMWAVVAVVVVSFFLLSRAHNSLQTTCRQAYRNGEDPRQAGQAWVKAHPFQSAMVDLLMLSCGYDRRVDRPEPRELGEHLGFRYQRVTR